MKVILPVTAMLSLLAFGCGSSSAGDGAASATNVDSTSASTIAPAPAATDAGTTIAPAQTTIPAVDTSMSTVAGSAAEASATVGIADFAFVPADVHVAVGGTVTWTNNDKQQHTATGAGEFDAGAIQPGDSATVTFDTAGSFPYVCSFHPFMAGTITVG